jgi:hypothetical protein
MYHDGADCKVSSCDCRKKGKEFRGEGMRHMILELVRRPLLLPALACIVEVEPRILELII